MNRGGSLAGLVAVVTGAAGDIGRATATRFRNEGARVVLLDLPGSAVVSRAAELGPKETAVAVEGDVSSPADVARVVGVVMSRFGQVDVLVNNAGIVPMAPFLEFDAALFDRVMAVNVRGSFLMAQACAREMARKSRGAIVQIASTFGFASDAARGFSVYGMSKAAVRQMVHALAGELAPSGIRVNAVAPGTIDTAMTRNLLREEAAWGGALKRIPLRRFGKPDEIAAACAFLCSDEARYVTGQTLVVDGGRLVR